RNEGSSEGDIYVQKLGRDGNPLWNADGLAVCLEIDKQSVPVITADGEGGAVMVWLDDRAARRAIYAQRITSSGSVQWTIGGVFFGFVYSQQPRPFVHRGTNGGFLVTWWDSAPIFGTDKHPELAQKLDANGTRLWDPGEPDNQDLWGSGIEV